MNNIFLLSAALNPSTLKEVEAGIESLLEVLNNRDKSTDELMRYEGFWEQKSVHGYFYEIPYQLGHEFINLGLKLFESFKSIPFDIETEEDFDILFEVDANGFAGIDFTPTNISVSRQIIDIESFKKFKLNGAKGKASQSIQDFWDNRNILFPKLVFCDRIWQQIEHLSVNDDRFALINEKLKRLNLFASQWTEGGFDYKNLGLDNSPDTPTRVANTLELRTFDCPPIGSKVFSLHIKWSFGREFFRLYYFPNEEGKNVYIGYIGPKKDIGF